MKKNVSFLLPVLIFFLYSSSLSAAVYNWGTTGVADTSKVTEIFQLTNNSVDNELGGWSSFTVSPWSRDGKWIVYRDSSETGGTIHKMNVATGLSICLTDEFLSSSESIWNPSFGRDNKIYFEKNTASGYEIWRMNSNGTDRENLTAAHGGSDERYVKVSPDGQWIAFFHADALWIAQSDGSAAGKASGTVPVNTPQHSWSPDSQWLVYQGAEGSQRWIYKVRVDGTDNHPLTRPDALLTPQVHLWPSWSHDGEKIAYIWVSENLLDYSYHIKTITKEGQPLQESLDNTVTSSLEWTTIAGPLSWSPDSQWLTYIKEDANDDAIFITHIDGPGQKTQLTTGYTDHRPIWSPAGNQILFADYAPS